MKRYIAIGIVVIVVVAGLAVGLGRHHSPTTKKSAAPTELYAAMGDSVAAGLGLPTDPSDSSDCGRAAESYPRQVAAQLNDKLLQAACSGATIPAGISGAQPLDGTNLTPQLDQIFAAGKAKPSLVTITIGANDIHWTDLLTKCYSSTCGTPADTAQVAADLATLDTNLSTVLSTIQQKTAPTTAKVVVTGYYQVFPSSAATCSTASGLTSAEIQWFLSQEAALNKTIQTVAANYSFARFAQPNFAGHELCTSEPWIQDTTASAPFHPTQEGQTAIAKAVLAAVK